MKETKLTVRNIYCNDCSEHVKEELKKLGAKSININMDSSDIQKVSLRCTKCLKKKEIIDLLQKRGIELISIRYS
ncbi:MAG: hypothetical protein AABW89_03035 [Nanoarchaeota archaeon]